MFLFVYKAYYISLAPQYSDLPLHPCVQTGLVMIFKLSPKMFPYWFSIMQYG